MRAGDPVRLMRWSRWGILTTDVRWIAASQHDLRARISSGAFREDLYHRLSVFPVRLPRCGSGPATCCRSPRCSWRAPATS